ncbi:hypothetical protein CVV65_06950 [Kyrpidia spormannii]|uniref:Uncharacterized protein n=1 Tax=Kyrpidia spormannii TaxID=2055160 RepID=A0A2K8N7B1_9BACL|nr:MULTISPECIES: hypothetical protein [Kyrpidia]ATY84697.1 hypothetical protein CVV65_06950 [Kyrpidia spormannii]MCL6577161.1 hypothetical protein [Kyrpidia sp.]
MGKGAKGWEWYPLQELDRIAESARREVTEFGPLLHREREVCQATGCPEELIDRLLEAASGYYQAVGRLVCAGLVKRFTSEFPDDTMRTESDDRGERA